MIELRPYQKDDINTLRAAFARKVRALLYVLATGGGKTFVFCYVALSAVARGHKTLIMCHRRHLLRQASLSLARLGLMHRIVAPPATVKAIRAKHVAEFGRSFVDPDSLVALASVPSLTRCSRLAWLIEWQPRLMVFDEAHHVAAKTWRTIIAAVPLAWILGVTATPSRLDGQGLDDCFQEMILGPDIPELVALGFLCPVRCWAPPLRADLSKIHIVGGDLDKAELTRRMNHPHITGDAIEHYENLCPGEPALVFCCGVEHAHAVAAQFCANGWRFEVLVGDTDGDDRDRQLDDLAHGRLDGVVSVDVLVEGTDVPAAVVAILLRPSESLLRYLQMVGRVMRPDGGKPFGRVHDHVGLIARFGLPQIVRAWTLKGRKKGAANDDDGGEVAHVAMCPVCFYAAEPREVCGGELPNGAFCEYVFPVKSRHIDQVAGTLEEVSDAAPTKISTGAARDYKALRAAGCSHGRAQHILLARKIKNDLIDRVMELIHIWLDAHPSQICECGPLDEMKPKQLKALIERLEAETGGPTVEPMPPTDVMALVERLTGGRPHGQG